MKDERKTKKQLIAELEELRGKLGGSPHSPGPSPDEECEASEVARQLVESVYQPMLVLDPGLKVMTANNSFYRTFRTLPDQTEKRNFFELGNKQWDIPGLRVLLEEVASRDTRFHDFEVNKRFPDIGQRTMLLSGHRIRLGKGSEPMILLAIEDATDRLRVRERLSQEAWIASEMAAFSRSLIQSKSIEEITNFVLDYSKRLTGSKYGFVSYRDPETGYMVGPTLTREVWDQCRIENKSIIFEKFTGLWGWVINNKKPMYTNQVAKDPRSSGTPPGHVPIDKFLSAPALVGDRVVGQIALANPGRDYTEFDLNLAQRIAAAYAFALQRRKAEEEMARALEESKKHAAETEGMLRGARAVLQGRSFEEAAERIFTTCKELTGAAAGYIALLSSDGSQNDVVYLDGGGYQCTVPEDAPMPVRGLREKAYQTGETVFDNDFAKSEHARLLPKGHTPLESVLFAPLKIRGNTVGLLGMGNKPGGFDQEDAAIATAFAELAAVALDNTRNLQGLEESEKKFRLVLQTATEAVVTINGNGEIVYWNPAAQTVFGYAPEDALGRTLGFIMPEALRADHARAFEVARSRPGPLRPGQTREVTGLRKGGAEFPAELTLAGWMAGGELFFTGMIRDITERKKSEDLLRRHRDQLEDAVEARTAEVRQVIGELTEEIEERKRTEEKRRQSEARLAEAQRMAHLGNWDWDIVTKGLYWSDEIYRIFGLTPQQFGATYDAFLNSVYPEDREFVMKSVDEALYRDIPYSIEHRILLPTGEVRFVHERAEVFFDEARKPVRMIGTVQDVTERKRAELARESAEKKLEEQRLQAVHADRLRSLGEMAAGIAHELNQPLQGVRGLAEHLSIALDRGWKVDQEDIRDKVELIVNQADRMSHVIEHTRMFAREADSTEIVPVDVNEVISSSLGMIGAQLKGRGIELDCELFEDLPLVMANPFSLEEVILNLISNARDATAMAKGQEDGLSPVCLRTGLDGDQANKYIKIEVSDRGAGIPPEIVDRVFEPFFTTKDPDKGTGLGLAICRSIIEGFGGSIRAGDNPDGGTVITVSLPAYEAAAGEEK